MIMSLKKQHTFFFFNCDQGTVLDRLLLKKEHRIGGQTSASSRERSYVVRFHLYDISSRDKSTETEERLGVPRGWGERDEKWLFTGYGVFPEWWKYFRAQQKRWRQDTEGVLNTSLIWLSFLLCGFHHIFLNVEKRPRF